MNILTINLALSTPEYGPPYRTNNFAEEWVRNGHNVMLLGSTYSHLMRAPVPGNEAVVDAQHKGVQYRLLRLPVYQGSGLSRGVHVMAGLARTLLRQDRYLKGFKPDLVIAGTVYQTDNYAAAKIARRFNGVFFRETRDLWPLTIIETSHKMNASHPFVRLVQHAEDHGYKCADMVCTTLENSYEYMKTRGLPPERFAYMPQSPEFNRPASQPPPPEHVTAFAKARAENRFIVIFAGSFNPYSELKVVLNAAKLLPNEAMFFVIGHGPVESELREYIGSQKISNVQLLPAIARGQLPELFAASDAGIVGFSGARIFNYGISPNKLFEYSSYGLPVILYANTKKTPISEGGGGFQVSAADPQAIADATRKLIAMSKEERRAMGERGRQYIATHHHLPTVAARYVDLAGEILARKRRAPAG